MWNGKPPLKKTVMPIPTVESALAGFGLAAGVFMESCTCGKNRRKETAEEGSLYPVEITDTNWLPYVAVEVSGNRMLSGNRPVDQMM